MPPTEPEEEPPVPLGRGGLTHAQGLMLRRRAVLGTPKCEKSSCWSPGLRPGPRWGSSQRSPRPPSWWGGGLSPRTPLTILSLCLSCVYVHTCMKMHCYFLLNVKHGASQLYLGGLQLSSAGTGPLCTGWAKNCTFFVARQCL